METYVTIELKCEASKLPLIQQILTDTPALAEESLPVLMKRFGYRASMALAAMCSGDDSMLDYFEGLEENEETGDGLHLQYTCGHEGLAFGTLLLHALCSHCSAIEMQYDHDEDPPEEMDWPLRFQWNYQRQNIVDTSSGRPVVVGGSQFMFVDEPALQGPVLTAAILQPLREIIGNGLLSEPSTQAPLLVTPLLETLERIVPVLVALEETYHSGHIMSDENRIEFQNLREQHGEFIESPEFCAFFAADLRDTLEKIRLIDALGTLIVTYDAIFYICSGLIGFLEAGGGDSLRGALKSQTDYVCWREHFLEQIEHDIEENDDDAEN